MTEVFYAIMFFVLGTLIGSFLNVCAYRIPKKESVAYPASHCTSCGTPIKPYDNIPLLSYAILRGKCRQCGERISLRYPLIEAVVGALWMCAYLCFGLSNRLGVALFFLTVITVLSVIDIDTKTIPNKILIPSIVVGMAVASLYVVNINLVPIFQGYNGFWAFMGMFAGGGTLLSIAMLGSMMFKKEAMGMGDVKLAAFVGLFLGGYVILALFLGFLIGSIISVALIFTKKVGRKDLIPFGPYVGAGAIVTLFFGPQIWHAYLKLAGF
jgi:leader peptidase (prepilin peptidase)/N-methyltransferase